MYGKTFVMVGINSEPIVRDRDWKFDCRSRTWLAGWFHFVIARAFYPLLLGVSSITECRFIHRSAYIFSHKNKAHFALYGCSALLGELYLFIPYALRCYIAFRNLYSYLGIAMLIFDIIFIFFPIKSFASLV